MLIFVHITFLARSSWLMDQFPIRFLTKSQMTHSQPIPLFAKLLHVLKGDNPDSHMTMNGHRKFQKNATGLDWYYRYAEEKRLVRDSIYSNVTVMQALLLATV